MEGENRFPQVVLRPPHENPTHTLMLKKKKNPNKSLSSWVTAMSTTDSGIPARRLHHMGCPPPPYTAGLARERWIYQPALPKQNDQSLEAGEGAQWSSVLAALPQDPSSVLSSPERSSQPPVTDSRCGGPLHSSSLRECYTHVHVLTHRRTHIIKNNKS